MVSFLARLNNVPASAAAPEFALGSASTNVKVFVKDFKTSLFPNLTTDLLHLWYGYTYWSKTLRSATPTTSRSCQGQGHRLRIFMLTFYVKVYRISLLLH